MSEKEPESARRAVHTYSEYKKNYAALRNQEQRDRIANTMGLAVREALQAEYNDKRTQVPGVSKAEPEAYRRDERIEELEKQLDKHRSVLKDSTKTIWHLRDTTDAALWRGHVDLRENRGAYEDAALESLREESEMRVLEGKAPIETSFGKSQAAQPAPESRPEA